MITAAIIIGIVSYLIGSINSSILMSRAMDKDIRTSGSGNAGATNMLRTYGKKMGAITLILDILKGVVCILIANTTAKAMTGGNIDAGWAALPYIAGVCVALGHNFPLYFGFKGGKGVATSLGVVLMLDWKIGLIVAVIAIGIMAITKYVSLGSIIGGITFIAAEIIKMAVTGGFRPIQLICAVILGGLLVIRHHANIKRLLNGTENKLGSKKK